MEANDYYRDGLVFREVAPLAYLLVGFRRSRIGEFVSKKDGFGEYLWTADELRKLRDAGCSVVAYRSGEVPRLF